MYRIYYLLFFLLCFSQGQATLVSKTLYLNRGLFLAVDSTTFPALAFNATPVFNQKNEKISLSPGDSLALRIINTDTATHGFFAPGFMASGWTLLPGDTLNGTLFIPVPGMFLFWDDSQFPANRYLGATGMIISEYPNTVRKFYWDIREFQSAWNHQIGNGATVPWQNFKPDYFVLNGQGRPGILLDPEAMVTGNTGDTIHIYMANTGLGLHSIHFHGYHSEILYSSEDPLFQGRIKDTFPMESMQTMILRLIPDKPGKYPVHDHNLIAVTAGGYYKNGIFLYLDIQ